MLLYLRVQVAQSLEIAKVPGWVLISGLESGVVVADHGIKEISEGAVGLSIRSVHTETRVQVLNALKRQFIIPSDPIDKIE